jgi:carbonic anhydrase
MLTEAIWYKQGGNMQHDTPHWEYSGSNGPEHWGELSREFAPCKNGRAQSPIDFTTTEAVRLDPLIFNYQPCNPTIINDSYTIQVNYTAPSSISVGSDEYQLVQFHFHTPSAHSVNGQHTAMELHLVHRDANHRLAVVGVFLIVGAANPALETLWQLLPAYEGAERPLNTVFNAIDLLPADRRTIRYEGSLTTPPCTEGVLWLMMMNPVEVSQAQVDRFRTIFVNNNRPIQPLNNRRVLQEAPPR